MTCLGPKKPGGLFEASSPEQQLDYAWSCWQGAVNDTSGEPCEVNVTDWSSARLEVEALEEGSYSFRLQVWSRNSSRMADAWWWVRVRRRRIPLVVGQVPWSSGGLVSVRAPVAPAIGHVFGSAACPMPVGWSWHWLLTGDDYILAILNTSVQSLGSSLEVRSSDFRGHLLTPEESYGYALMGLSPGEPRPLAGTRLPPDGFVWRSDSFWADAPPVDGLLELQPSSGEALITAFTASTFGWQDRQEAELSYAFFRFPLRSTGVWADGRGGLILEESFKWSMPAIDWSNSLSSRYFRRQGGLALRTWVPRVVS